MYNNDRKPRRKYANFIIKTIVTFINIIILNLQKQQHLTHIFRQKIKQNVDL